LASSRTKFSSSEDFLRAFSNILVNGCDMKGLYHSVISISQGSIFLLWLPYVCAKHTKQNTGAKSCGQY
jgi:hypothetical protein